MADVIIGTTQLRSAGACASMNTDADTRMRFLRWPLQNAHLDLFPYYGFWSRGIAREWFRAHPSFYHRLTRPRLNAHIANPPQYMYTRQLTSAVEHHPTHTHLSAHELMLMRFHQQSAMAKMRLLKGRLPFEYWEENYNSWDLVHEYNSAGLFRNYLSRNRSRELDQTNLDVVTGSTSWSAEDAQRQAAQILTRHGLVPPPAQRLNLANLENFVLTNESIPQTSTEWVHVSHAGVPGKNVPFKITNYKQSNGWGSFIYDWGLVSHVGGGQAPLAGKYAQNQASTYPEHLLVPWRRRAAEVRAAQAFSPNQRSLELPSYPSEEGIYLTNPSINQHAPHKGAQDNLEQLRYERFAGVYVKPSTINYAHDKVNWGQFAGIESYIRVYPFDDKHRSLIHAAHCYGRSEFYIRRQHNLPSLPRKDSVRPSNVWLADLVQPLTLTRNLFGTSINPTEGKYQLNYCYVQENVCSFKWIKNSCDMFVGYTDISGGNDDLEGIFAHYGNYLQFPGWIVTILYRYGEVPTLAQLRELFADLQVRREKNPFKRPLMAALLARHNIMESYEGVRESIFRLFDHCFKPNPVRCPSRFLHNDDSLKEEFNDDKLAYLQQFTYNICPENTYHPGYVTEKIFEAYEAGCIPVYWGGIESELDIFNPEAFLYFDPRKPLGLTERIQQLFTDEQAQLDLVKTPIFHPGAAERTYLRYFAPMARRLYSDVNLNVHALQKTDWQTQARLAEEALAQLEMVEDTYSHLLVGYQDWPFVSDLRYNPGQ